MLDGFKNYFFHYKINFIDEILLTSRLQFVMLVNNGEVFRHERIFADYNSKIRI